MVRTALYEAAHIMLTRATRLSALKRWAMEVAKRRGMKRAKVALARKLATVLHRIWALMSVSSVGARTPSPRKGGTRQRSRRQRHCFFEVPSLGRGLGKVGSSVVKLRQITCPRLTCRLKDLMG